jgi:hypothetical protein
VRDGPRHQRCGVWRPYVAWCVGGGWDSGRSCVARRCGYGNIIQFAVQTRDGDSWSAVYATGDGSPLHVGTHATNGGPGSAWQGYADHGRGCAHFSGAFTITGLTYDPNGGLRAFSVNFEAHCEGLPEALRGTFSFRAA